jgi:predicted nucleic acid-binding protein
MTTFTERKLISMNELFLDSSFAIALAAVSDLHHAGAVSLSEQIESQNIRLVTTQAVLLEIGNALSRQRYRTAAVELLSSLQSDPSIEVVPLTESVYDRAFKLYCNRTDKEWGLTDCISFVVMQDRGLHKALTADDHFRQAGFRALLLET